MHELEQTDFTMEEMLPIVAELTRRYTHWESSSITYEKAQQLMEAVLYCIKHSDKSCMQSPQKAYERGYDNIVRLVRAENEQYNKMISSFNAYGNIAYYETVVKGIPSFFLYYDARFEPQNHLLTLDYETLLSVREYEGIDCIQQFLKYIRYEQTFLLEFEEQYVIRTLEKYHEDYQELIINVCSVVLRNILICLWIGKPIVVNSFTSNQIKELREQLLQLDNSQILRKLEGYLRILIREQFKANEGLYEYLVADLPNFTVELVNAAQCDCLETLLGE